MASRLFRVGGSALFASVLLLASTPSAAVAGDATYKVKALRVLSGHVVLLQVIPEVIAPRRSAPLRFALVRFASVMSASDSVASDRFALVRFV